MTKVLIISHKSDLTSDFIVKRLKENGIDFYRFNTDELTKSVSFSLNFNSNSFCLFDLNTKEKIDLKEISSVYFRRPELPVVESAELNKGEINLLKNEIIYTLEGIYKLLRNAYWISPIYSIREAENKIYQLELAKYLDFKIPKSIVSNTYEDVAKFYEDNNENCIIKPIKSGLIENEKESQIIFTSLLKNKPDSVQQIKSCPNFLQSHIPKKGDVRVTMVGNKAFSTFIHSQDSDNTKIDWRKGETILKHSKIELTTELTNKCIQLLKSLNLKFGAIDFILDENDEFTFLEINPNGQWAWIEKQTGYKISNEIINLLQHESF